MTKTSVTAEQFQKEVEKRLAELLKDEKPRVKEREYDLYNELETFCKNEPSNEGLTEEEYDALLDEFYDDHNGDGDPRFIPLHDYIRLLDRLIEPYRGLGLIKDGPYIENLRSEYSDDMHLVLKFTAEETPNEFKERLTTTAKNWVSARFTTRVKVNAKPTTKKSNGSKKKNTRKMPKV